MRRINVIGSAAVAALAGVVLSRRIPHAHREGSLLGQQASRCDEFPWQTLDVYN